MEAHDFGKFALKTLANSCAVSRHVVDQLRCPLLALRDRTNALILHLISGLDRRWLGSCDGVIDPKRTLTGWVAQRRFFKNANFEGLSDLKLSSVLLSELASLGCGKSVEFPGLSVV
jgi:hypothetical protein